MNALTDGRYKVILGGRDAAEAYDLNADPGEHVNLATHLPLRVAYARQAIAALRPWRVTVSRAPTPRLDSATLERLRALGYSE